MAGPRLMGTKTSMQGAPPRGTMFGNAGAKDVRATKQILLLYSTRPTEIWRQSCQVGLPVQSWVAAQRRKKALSHKILDSVHWTSFNFDASMHRRHRFDAYAVYSSGYT